MPLSMNNNIVARDIDEIIMLKAPVVWLLKGNDNDQIVVKRENAEQSLFKSSKMAVKTIDPGAAKVKVLNQSEVDALKQCIQEFKRKEQAYELMGGAELIPKDESSAMSILDRAMKGNETWGGVGWLKMDALNVKELATALQSRLGVDAAGARTGKDADKTDLRSFTKMLNARGGLEKLGQLLVIDLFTDNGDRFVPERPGMGFLPGFTDFRCITGPQNVFRIRTDGVDEVGSLDFIPNEATDFTNINTPLAEAERAGGPWKGRVLADRNRRKQYAKDVVHDLELILNPHKGNYSPFSKLKGDPVSRVDKGMIDGCRRLTFQLHHKYQAGRWTQGIADRDAILQQAIDIPKSHGRWHF